MAKSTVAATITKMKRRYDYNITDSDLDDVLVDCINDALKLIYQWLFDAGKFVDIGASTTLTIVASTAYIDISTALASADEILKIAERTNDKPLNLIDYADFVDRYPDPTASYAVMPEDCAIWYNRLYLGPTPNAAGTLYADYLAVPTDVTSGSTLPYKTLYDPLLIAIARTEYLRWYDSNNIAAIRSAEQVMEYYKHELITGASKNIGMERQVQSRGDRLYVNPRSPQ